MNRDRTGVVAMGFEPENIKNGVRRAAAQRRRSASARFGADGPERSTRDERRSREQPPLSANMEIKNGLSGRDMRNFLGRHGS
jgi:hypothetical protein